MSNKLVKPKVVRIERSRWRCGGDGFNLSFGGKDITEAVEKAIDSKEPRKKRVRLFKRRYNMTNASAEKQANAVIKERVQNYKAMDKALKARTPKIGKLDEHIKADSRAMLAEVQEYLKGKKKERKERQERLQQVESTEGLTPDASRMRSVSCEGCYAKHLDAQYDQFYFSSYS